MCHDFPMVGPLLIINTLEDTNFILLLRLQILNIFNLGFHGFNPAAALLNQNAEAR